MGLAKVSRIPEKQLRNLRDLRPLHARTTIRCVISLKSV